MLDIENQTQTSLHSDKKHSPKTTPFYKASNSMIEDKQEYLDKFKKTSSTLKANKSGHIKMSLNEDLRISKNTINYTDGSNSNSANTRLSGAQIQKYDAEPVHLN